MAIADGVAQSWADGVYRLVGCLHVRLPEEHAVLLTRAAAAENLAVFAQYIAGLGGTVSPAHGGEGLGAMWSEEKTREYLQHAGFRSIETHQLVHDIQNNWYVVRQ